jgi:hypothetical protein
MLTVPANDDPRIDDALTGATVYWPRNDNRVWTVQITSEMCSAEGQFRVGSGGITGRVGDYLVIELPDNAGPPERPDLSGLIRPGVTNATAQAAAARLDAQIVNQDIYHRTFAAVNESVATRTGGIRALTWTGESGVPVRGIGRDIYMLEPGTTLVVGGDFGDMETTTPEWIAKRYIETPDAFGKLDTYAGTFLFNAGPNKTESLFHVIGNVRPISIRGHWVIVVNQQGPAGRIYGLADLPQNLWPAYEAEFRLHRAIAMLYGARTRSVPVLAQSESGRRLLNPRQSVPSAHFHVIFIDRMRFQTWRFNADTFIQHEIARRVAKKDAQVWRAAGGIRLEELLAFAAMQNSTEARRVDDDFPSRSRAAHEMSDAVCTVQVGDGPLYMLNPLSCAEGIFNQFLGDTVAFEGRGGDAVRLDLRVGNRLNLVRSPDLGTEHTFEAIQGHKTPDNITTQGNALRAVLTDPMVVNALRNPKGLEQLL